MHKTFVFPLPSNSSILKLEKPHISEINGEVYIWSEKENAKISYDAFDYPELIPELIALVRKTKNGRNRNKLAEQWVSKWGIFRNDFSEEGIHGQKLSTFWRDAEDFEIAWRVYKYIANRELEILKMGLGFLEEIDDLKQYSADPLTNYQWNGMKFIMYAIESHTKNGVLTAAEIRRDENEEEDSFTVKPTYFFNHLIDSLYMQFFMSLTENKKVCPICEKPFTPQRKSAVYCSSSCKLTARSRRYRDRKSVN